MYRHLIFDLDGTLTDPMTGIIRSVNYALKACGFPEISGGNDFSWFIGPPLRESLKMLVGSGHEALAEKMVAAYRERYATIGLYENTVYPGITELLMDLSVNGKKLILGTSKPVAFASRIMKHFGLDHLFDRIVGSELDGTRSNKEEIIKHVIDVYGGETSDYLVIGDREADILGARRNNIDSVGVLWGYGRASEIAGSGPTFVAKDVGNLRAILLA